jgi:hypothetical protein
MASHPELSTLITLRELDQSLGLAKGSAFRAFKQLQFVEARDFWVLKAGTDAAAIAELRAKQRIYITSINVVVLSSSAAEKKRNYLRTV